MMKQLKVGAVFLVAAGALGLAGGAPAQAAPLCPAANQPLSSFSPTPFTCSTASGFDFTFSAFTGFTAFDTLSINSTSSSFTIGVLSDANWSPDTYTLNYSITAPTGKVLNNYTSSLTSSVGSAAGSDAGTWTVVGANGPALATFSTPNAVNGNVPYSPQITSDTFASTLAVSNGVIQSVTSTVNVVDAPPPPSSVPTPLPLLGAGAAFGFSRRIRSRIKLAA